MKKKKYNLMTALALMMSPSFQELKGGYTIPSRKSRMPLTLGERKRLKELSHRGDPLKKMLKKRYVKELQAKYFGKDAA